MFCYVFAPEYVLTRARDSDHPAGHFQSNRARVKLCINIVLIDAVSEYTSVLRSRLWII